MNNAGFMNLTRPCGARMLVLCLGGAINSLGLTYPQPMEMTQLEWEREVEEFQNNLT